MCGEGLLPKWLTHLSTCDVSVEYEAGYEGVGCICTHGAGYTDSIGGRFWASQNTAAFK